MALVDASAKAAGRPALPPRPAALSTCPWAAPESGENRGRKKTPTGSTCPWEVPANYIEPIKKGREPRFEGCAGRGAPKIGQSRDPSPRQGTHERDPSRQSTCPWNDGSDVSIKPKKRTESIGRSPRGTCPWEGNVPDRDSRALAEAAQRRQKAHPGFDGCAGSGAPKQRPQVVQDVETINVEDGDLAADALNENGGDNEHAIIRRIIDAGLEMGLSRDEIEAEIRVYQETMSEERANKENELTIKVHAKNNPQMPASAVSRAGTVAAQRQKLAAQRNGPSDQEIVKVLQEHSPPETPDPNCMSLADKRQRAKEVSPASLASYNSDKSHASYAQNQQSAAAARNRNRAGAGIF